MEHEQKKTDIDGLELDSNAVNSALLIPAQNGGDAAQEPSSFMDKIRDGFTSFGEKAKGAATYLGEKAKYVRDIALQTGHFVLFHRDLIAFAFVAVALLPLFNFASMGAIAYIAYPALALTVMYLGYYKAPSNILKEGLKKEYLNGWLTIDAKFKASEKNDYDAKLDLADEGHESLPNEEDVDDTEDLNDKSQSAGVLSYASFLWNVFLKTELVMLFSDSLSLDTIKDKWKQAGKDKTWQNLGENLAKIGLLYAGIYLAANSLVAPILVGPLHAALALGGTFGLVASYFALAGSGYGAAYAANNVDKVDKGSYLEYGAYALATVGVVAITATAVVLGLASIVTAIVSAVGVTAAVVPAVFALAAFSLSAVNMVADKAKGLDWTDWTQYFGQGTPTPSASFGKGPEETETEKLLEGDDAVKEEQNAPTTTTAPTTTA